MKINRKLTLLLSFFLFACQPTTSPTVTIIDNDQIHTLQTDERLPAAILAQAGITVNPNDHILLNGLPAPLDQQFSNSLISSHLVIQIRRAVNLTITSPQGEQQIQTSAFTVGEALLEAGIQLSASDKVDPPLNSPILQSSSPVTIYQLPSPVTITADGKSMQITSSARTVGQALAEAGIPLLGRDYSLPAEKEALPADGQIRVVRVSESILLTQKPIPFQSQLIASADVPLDQTQIIQPGESGLSVQRIRIRYEDGDEIARTTAEETMVRPPKDRVLGYGTKIEIKTAVVDGVTIEYWRAVQMYATSYSPCRLGTPTCGSTTASGKELQKGMVALRTDLYLSMRGQPLFIPGYGRATVEDACGGCTGGLWIDLGYNDNNWQQWSSWVTVYFLTPVPSNVIYVLE